MSAIVVLVAWMLLPGLFNQVVTDLDRFRPDPTRMAVLEARPLFLYTGNWTWSQPWMFFRSGFYVGLVAVAGAGRERRGDRAGVDHMLISCFTVVNYLATLGQNRFGYYLVPASAVVIAWLCVRVLDWGGVPHAGNPQPSVKRPLPFQREIAVDRGRRPGRRAESGAGGDHHDARRRHAGVLVRRDDVAPHLNARAVRVARLLLRAIWRDESAGGLQRDELVGSGLLAGAGGASRAGQRTRRRAAPTSRRRSSPRPTRPPRSAILEGRPRAVRVVDWELPFRDAGDGALAGRFQNLADWAGIPTSRFYSLCYSRKRDSRSLGSPPGSTPRPTTRRWSYRLMVLGGRPRRR